VKLCPLSKSGVVAPCDEENCAWWDVDLKMCAVKSIQDSLYSINDVIVRKAESDATS
jgi:hypothetical protein